LIAFEESIAEKYNNAEIPYPVHLSKGNELQLIEIFKDFKQGDWVFNSWRSHLHALLAGVPPEKVREAIFKGRSMTLCWPEHRMFCSAIVGGVIPIAMGVAWQIKRMGGQEHVWLFIGDMTARIGAAYECNNYARWHNLPITFVIENNGKSVCTDTNSVWMEEGNLYNNITRSYNWDLSKHYPHAGAGRRIQF